MAEEKKVFDVAKPGSTKPEMGAKPMVVGHKIMKDPTLVSTTEDDDAQKTEQLISQPSKVVVSPISAEFSAADDDKINETSNNEKQIDTLDKKKAKQKTSSQDDPGSDVEKLEIEETPEEIKENADTLGMERELSLQKIIKEKTYVVPVQEATYSAFKTFIKTFVLVGLLGVLILVLLIDAEIINVGISLPFDFL